MTCRAARPRRRGRGGARAGASRAGSRGRRDRTWPGARSQTPPCRTGPAGVVCVLDRGARDPGAPLRRADRGPDRRGTLAGFVHSMIERAAAAVAESNKAIRCLIILAHVICADETPIRVGPGPKTRKRYLLVACTRLLTCYFLGDRSMDTFEGFVFPDLSGVIVHDRYHNYDKLPGATHHPSCHHPLT